MSRDGFDFIGKRIAEDHFIPGECRTKSTNVPKRHDSPIKHYLHVPNPDINDLDAGVEYVQLENGKCFKRYDTYYAGSPYGWTYLGIYVDFPAVWVDKISEK